MMDFEDAAQRLARDQQKLRGRRVVTVSAKAKREADFRKKQQERLRQERQQKQKQYDFMIQYMTACDRSLGVKQLSSSSSLPGASAATRSISGLQLTPTSIYGDGDKIALPPSVLEFLTTQSSSVVLGDETSSSPWMFRIGLVNPMYSFPQSVILQTLKDDDHDDDTMHDSDDDHDEDGHSSSSSAKEAYLDELAHKYISYTHGTVVEFTQDEGHVGLPSPIAAALLDPKRRLPEHANFDIPVIRTKDPSFMDTTATASAEGGDKNDDDEKTPGHVAWGAFDVPEMPLEITMVRLPKGKGCTLTPTDEAMQNGFYNLQDVKLVLEQSLIRTRATLSVGDTVQTWHRGIKFDLHVTKVLPATINAVTCINTDIEVELGEVSNDKNVPFFPATEEGSMQPETKAMTGGGHTLSSGVRVAEKAQAPLSNNDTAAVKLLPEPPQDQKDGICTVQIRSDGIAPDRRRFDVHAATLGDLFAFATSIIGGGGQPEDPSIFRLVTRFPRKVYELDDTNYNVTMAEAGVQPGQELFMLERL